MIDTIELLSNDFELDLMINAKSQYPLINETLAFNPLANIEQPLLLKDRNGYEVRGIGLRLEKPLKETGILSIGNWETNHVVSSWLRIRMSLPNFLNGSNFYTATQGDLIRGANELSKELKDIGIYVNPLSMRLSRLDLTKNVELNYPVPVYLQTLKECTNNCKRAMSFSKEVNTQTFTAIKTKYNQVCAYNKLDCMANNNEPIFKELEGKNILRVENRFLKKDTVKAHTGFLSLNDLLEGYELLNGIYRKEVKTTLFNNKESFEDFSNIDTLNQERTFQDIESLALKCMEYCKGKSENWFNMFVTLYQASVFKDLTENLKEYGIDKLLDLQVEYELQNGVSKTTVKQRKARTKNLILKKLSFINEFLSREINSKTVSYSDLFQELYEKLIA